MSLTATPELRSAAVGQQSADVPHRPLALVASAMIAGIVGDAHFGWQLHIWLGVAVLALVGWAIDRLLGRQFAAAACLWLAVANCGGAWHHYRTHIFAENDIGHFVADERALMRVRGVVATTPRFRRTSADDLVLHATGRQWTYFQLTTIAACDSGRWRPTSGRMAVYLDGPQIAIVRGDRVEIVGWASRPNRPWNPGEFDFARWLHSRQIDAVMACEDSQAAVVTERASPWSIVYWRNLLLAEGSERFRRHLGYQRGAVLDALIFGDEAGLAREELVPFLESGTLHLLVVSGFHLVVFGGATWLACGLLRWPFRRRCACVMAVAIAYAFLTGGNPPVVRAAVIMCIYLGGLLFLRPMQPLNTLAGAAIVVLILDPTELFRAGTQLSFLCVLALHLFAGRICNLALVGFQNTDLYPSPAYTTSNRVKTVIASGVLASFVVTLLTTPLCLHQFHLMTPIAVLFTPILSIPVTLLLILAPMLLLVSESTPVIAPLLALPIRACLDAINWVVTNAEHVPFGRVFAPSMPGWWTVGLYLVFLAPWFFRRFVRPGTPYLFANLAWLVVGLVTVFVVPSHDQTELHQLAVGHGGCAVIRCPDGTHVMFDCGSLAGPEVAERIVAPFLWRLGVASLDAVLVSHGDIDHFNGLIALARRITIRKIYISPHLARDTEPAVQLVLRSLADQGVPIHLAWSGDRLHANQLSMTVLHPAPGADERDDNSACMVVMCESAGKRALLTGDIAGDGLAKLLRQTPQDIHVLLAPHHGSRFSNSTELADWAKPRLVISSQGSRLVRGNPLAVYEDRAIPVLRTNLDGAVSCRLGANALAVSSFRTQKDLWLP